MLGSHDVCHQRSRQFAANQTSAGDIGEIVPGDLRLRAVADDVQCAKMRRSRVSRKRCGIELEARECRRPLTREQEVRAFEKRLHPRFAVWALQIDALDRDVAVQLYVPAGAERGERIADRRLHLDHGSA